MKKLLLALGLALSLTGLALVLAPEPHQIALAASADITLGNDVATIEVDSTQRTATRDPGTIRGYVVNGGSVKIFIHTGAGTVATTDAQATSIVGLPPGASFRLRPGKAAFTYKTASSSSVMYWFPE